MPATSMPIFAVAVLLVHMLLRAATVVGADAVALALVAT